VETSSITKTKIFILLFAGLISLVFFIFFSTNNFAQTAISSQGIEVSPPSNEFDVDPGETKEFEVKVRNTGNNNYYMRARVEDFTASGDEGQVALVEKSPYSISYWTTLDPQVFALAPGKTQVVKVRSNLPTQNVGGGRYGAVVFAVSTSEIQNAANDPTPNTASVAQEIASLFLFRVAGPVEENLTILNFKAPQFAEFGPIPLQLSVSNNGNVHVKAAGLVSVSNILGKKISDLVIAPTNIFPQAKRVLEVSFNQNFMIGPYQARAILFYGNDNNTIEAFVPFFVFPVRFVAAIIGFILLIYVIIKYAKRKSQHQK
jgi:P pilus assembly chaperone PapD